MVRTQRYEVPVVLQDLPPAETLHQLFDNLKYLETVVDDIFGRLEGRLSGTRSRLSGITSRLSAAQGKVSQIGQQTSKATTIYSINKYPVSEGLPDYQPISTRGPLEDMMTIQRTAVKLPPAQRSHRTHAVDATHLFNKMNKVRSTDASSQAQEGLGRLPNNIVSVSNVLVFNSSANPYKRYVSLDNLEGIGGKDREIQEEGLHDAPQTLIDGDMLPQLQMDLGFKPTLNAPEFIAPAMLPDLSGVAEINWGGDDSALASIAPSAGALPALPAIDGWTTSSAPPPAPAQSSTVIGATTDNIPDPPKAPAAPTPTTAPPPAAAPPAVVPKAIPKEAPPAQPGRGDLLAQIRNPKMKLKKAASRIIAANRKKKNGGKQEMADVGMDIMSMLKAKMKARSDAISGANDRGGDDDGPQRKDSVAEDEEWDSD